MPKIIRVTRKLEYQGEESWVSLTLSRSILKKERSTFRVGVHNRIKLVEEGKPVTIHDEEETQNSTRKLPT